jgi:hypothetical protein
MFVTGVVRRRAGGGGGVRGLGLAGRGRRGRIGVYAVAARAGRERDCFGIRILGISPRTTLWVSVQSTRFVLPNL